MEPRRADLDDRTCALTARQETERDGAGWRLQPTLSGPFLLPASAANICRPDWGASDAGDSGLVGPHAPFRGACVDADDALRARQEAGAGAGS
jgi:hypothetical protein